MTELLCAQCIKGVIEAEKRGDVLTFIVPDGVDLPEDIKDTAHTTKTLDETHVKLSKWRRWDAFRIVAQGGYVTDENRFPVMKAYTLVDGTALCPNHLGVRGDDLR